MIHIEEISSLVEKNKAPFIRVRDLAGNLLGEIMDSENTQTSIKRLLEMLEMFAEYGKVVVEAANESQKNQNFRYCYKWTVKVAAAPAAPGKQELAGVSNFAPAGYMSIAEYTAKLELEKLKLQIEELKKAKKVELPELPASYMFLAGELLGWDDNKTSRMVSGLAGAATTEKVKTSLHMTEEEAQEAAKQKLEQIQNLMLSIMSKVEADKIIKVLRACDEKPEMIDKVLLFF